MHGYLIGGCICLAVGAALYLAAPFLPWLS